ncbi:MAG: hypothetical protein QOG00_1354 [Pyrinomonadaceae bacterium]|nr:hypothetical protein [Pyrinomonadaceae bacterium]
MKTFRGAILLGVWLIVCSSHHLSAQESSAQEGNVTLKETVDWLQSKAYLITSVGANSLRETIDVKGYSKWELVLTNPCTVELKSSRPQLDETTSQGGSNKQKSQDKSKRDGDSRKVRSHDITRLGIDIEPPNDPSVITIPLSSLNPKKTSIAVLNGDIFTGGSVAISTTDDKEVIIWRGADKTFNAKSITIGFKQNGFTERVAKALGHAINLCGGRGDKKEPF